MYRFRKIEKDGTTSFIVTIDNTDVPVSKEVYDFLSHERDNARYRARRDGKCGNANFCICPGDCGHCPWVREGFNMISLEKAFGTATGCGHEDELSSLDNIPDPNASLIEDIVADRDMLSRLMTKLDTIVPDGGQIAQMLINQYSDREMTSALNLKSQSTLSGRKKKVKRYLFEHWNESID